MNPKYKYVLEYFCQLYNVPPEIEIGYGTRDASINITASETNYFEDFNPFPTDEPVWKHWRYQEIPFIFAGEANREVLEIVNGKAFINADVLAGAFFFLSGWQEFVYLQKHNATRYPYSDSLQARWKIAHIPLVNYYFDVLKSAIEQVYNITLTVDAWGQSPGAICLTHDIDNCYGGWKYDLFSQLKKKKIGDLFKIIAHRLTRGDTWFNFEDIIQLEKQYDATSSFYFIPDFGNVYFNPSIVKRVTTAEKSYDPADFFDRRFASRFRGYTTRLENADYDLRTPKIRDVFRTIRENGSEVGIHGGFGSFLSEAYYREGLSRFDEATTGSRFHYLNFDITTTYDILEKVDQRYDSTIGFAEVPGFRNGIAYPFKPYNIREDRTYNLLQIPLIAMDTTFRSYTNTALPHVLPTILGLFHEVQKFQGCLTVLWHNPYFTPYKYAGWREIYEGILKEGKQNLFQLTSGEKVYDQWQPVLERETKFS